MKDYLINLVSQVRGGPAKTNIMREYLQVYALRTIFEKGRFAQVVFVGGTALRFVFGLPRFSEDLDFSLTNPAGYDFEEMLSEIKRSFQDANYNLSARIKMERTVNTAMLKFPELMFSAGLTHRKDQNLSIKLDVDTRPPKGGKVIHSLVNKYFPITFAHYDLPSLFAGKLHAIFTRQYIKGRDYFDLARISHQFPTAAADKPVSTASHSKKVLDIGLAMPPRFFLRVPCIHGLLHRLATKIGEKCGLVWLLSRDRNLNPNIELLNAALEQTGSRLRVTMENWRGKVLEKIESADWVRIVADVEKFSEDIRFIDSMKPEYVRPLLAK